MSTQRDRSLGRAGWTAVCAGILLAAVGYVVLLSPWPATPTAHSAACPHELTWRSALYVARGTETVPGSGTPLTDQAYDAGCADRSTLPAERVLPVHRLTGVAPEVALVDGSGQVWVRVGQEAPVR